MRALLVLSFLLVGPAARAAAPPAPPDLDTLLTRARARWRAPGLAVAIVRDDRVIYLKGLGVRRQGGKEPVTPDTLFGVGSLTKAFTATALALLVDGGKVDWDDRVRKHLPWFRLSDPLADRDVTLRDLLCHRTGLARHDLLWYRAPWSLQESVRRMAFLPLARSFRSGYRYNNLSYVALGLAITAAARTPWHQFVQQRLLGPLGMKGAVFTAEAARKAADHATPHHRGPAGALIPLTWYPDDKQVRASGSLKAGARDLSRWLRLQLAGGALGDKRLVSAEALAETHTPQVVVPLDRRLARLTGATQASYGLGWHISDYRGHRLLAHGGAVDGFRARLLLLPGKRTGVVLLTNVDDSAFLQATGYVLLDHLLRLSRKDWHGHFQARVAAVERAARLLDRILTAGRRTGTRPAQALAAYAGTYRDPAYGTLTVARKGTGLRLRWSGFHVPLVHWHYETFLVGGQKKPLNRLAGEFAVFTLDEEAVVRSVRFLGRTFRRVAPRR
jgi:CubicO group peptidase (beta-lactamase class C family)